MLDAKINSMKRKLTSKDTCMLLKLDSKLMLILSQFYVYIKTIFRTNIHNVKNPESLFLFLVHTCHVMMINGCMFIPNRKRHLHD